MGMFDRVRSSLPVFGGVSDHTLQTKDLEGLMFDYWISPAGELFQVDLSHTCDLYQVPEGKRKHRLHIWDWRPNGNRGTVRPVRVEGPVIVYPSKWSLDTARWPHAELYFEAGVIQSVDTTIWSLRKTW